MKLIACLAGSLLLMGAAAPQDAGTTCPLARVPEVERPVKPTRPPVPGCVNEARGTHTCRNNALNAYQASLRDYEEAFTAYVSAVNAYISRLDDYTQEAVRYAECERRTVAPTAFISG